jgi:hypothetical protein
MNRRLPEKAGISYSADRPLDSQTLCTVEIAIIDKQRLINEFINYEDCIYNLILLHNFVV